VSPAIRSVASLANATAEPSRFATTCRLAPSPLFVARSRLIRSVAPVTRS
jgi:hypothetical protein